MLAGGLMIRLAVFTLAKVAPIALVPLRETVYFVGKATGLPAAT
jgi:hypothetical protein